MFIVVDMVYGFVSVVNGKVEWTKKHSLATRFSSRKDAMQYVNFSEVIIKL